MAEANWFWAEGEKQNGPAPLVTLARLIAGGKLGAKDLIWQEGMPDWIAVESVPALVKYLNPPSVLPVESIPAERAPSGTPIEIIRAESTPLNSIPADKASIVQTTWSEVGYYNPSMLPPRAALALQGHALPRGDIGEWPLDDQHLLQFDTAWKMRRQVLAAASLFRVLLIFSVLGCLFSAIGMIATMGSLQAGGGLLPAGLGMGAGLTAGLSILYYFAWKATLRSQAWAPMTVVIVFVLEGIYNIYAIIAAVSTSRFFDIPGPLITMLFAVGFTSVAYRGYRAISKYLMQPAWIQELLARTKK